MELQILESAIQAGNRIVCLLGYGVSADCGCFDYRDSNNAYDVETKYGYSPEEIFAASFLNTRTSTFFAYYRENILLKQGKPGNALMTLKRMEDDHKLFSVVTRSIYGLPERAGIRHHVDTHGTIYKNHCPHCGATYSIDFMMKAEGIPHCPNCGSVVRPDVVLDGEMIPNRLITEAANAVERADVLLILGATMKATLTQNCINYFDGNKIILINEEENYSDSSADLVFHGKPNEILPKIYR